jgi:signal transduction histidine kinase
MLAVSPERDAFLRTRVFKADNTTVVGHAVSERRVIHVADIQTEPAYAAAPSVVSSTGLRTALGVPLLRLGEPIGVLSLGRWRVEPFTDRQIELVRTFADQAVIAMENARLLGELRTARDTAEASLQQLKAAQASLIQAEKMASLGQLTAGIAHEIKNPLNFVNNFASLSVDLLDELKQAVAPGFAMLNEAQRAEVDDLTRTLSGNLEKINEHGDRADAIVRSMLEHSRGTSGERRSVDLNALVEDALNLAYHGARAQDQGFNVTLRRDFDEGVAPITLVPQDITRVLLNLFSNAFYAARRRQGMDATPGFEPTLSVATRELGDAVEIRVRDNGIGIPEEVRGKLFQPFFTTKPTGEGTGLGLSISYDIVTQQHGGSITVDSKVGEYSEFTIRLPRNP